MTIQERRELTEKLLAASLVTKPFTPPEHYQPAIEGTAVTQRQIDTGAGATDIWLVSRPDRPSASAVLINFHGGGLWRPILRETSASARDWPGT